VLYLYGIPAFVKEYPADFPFTYFYSSEASTIARAGHLVVTPSDPLITYHLWPFFLYFFAILQSVLGMPGRLASDLFSFLGISVFALFAFLIMRPCLGKVFSFYGVIWFLSSFWLGQQYFSPQSYSFVLFLALFLVLVMSFRNHRALSLGKRFVLLVIFLLFTAICSSHALTPLMIISGIVGVFMLQTVFQTFFRGRARREFTVTGAMCLTLVAVYLCYVVYGSYQAFSALLLSIVHMPEIGAQVLVQRRFGSIIQTLDNGSAWAIIVVTAVPLLLAMRDARYRKSNVFWIGWCVGVAVLSMLITYGAESYLRGLLFILVPLSYLIVDYLRKKPRMLCVLLLVLLLLHMPAQYLKDYNFMASPSEVAGTAFLAEYTQKDSSYYWLSCLAPMLWYQDPARIGMTCDTYNLGLGVSALENEMTAAQYAVISDSTRRVHFYYSGYDLFRDLPALESSGNLYYHDGSLRILSFQKQL
jgi:hypothetical protein